jgi:hypothetical protein
MNPNGRPRKLTPEQESRVYAEYTATNRGKRFKTLMRLARELPVCQGTLERIVLEQRKKHLAAITQRFHEQPHNSIPESP